MVSLSIPKNSFIFSGVIGPITGQWANNSPTTSHWSLQNILDYKELQSFDGAQTFAKRCKKLSEWDYSLCFSANNQQPTHLRIDTMNYDKCIKKKLNSFLLQDLLPTIGNGIWQILNIPMKDTGSSYIGDRFYYNLPNLTLNTTYSLMIRWYSSHSDSRIYKRSGTLFILLVWSTLSITFGWLYFYEKYKSQDLNQNSSPFTNPS